MEVYTSAPHSIFNFVIYFLGIYSWDWSRLPPKYTLPRKWRSSEGELQSLGILWMAVVRLLLTKWFFSASGRVTSHLKKSLTVGIVSSVKDSWLFSAAVGFHSAKELAIHMLLTYSIMCVHVRRDLVGSLSCFIFVYTSPAVCQQKSALLLAALIAAVWQCLIPHLSCSGIAQAHTDLLLAVRRNILKDFRTKQQPCYQL